MSMKVIIVGRSHTGKNTLAEILSCRFGLKVLKTCTSRPRRWPDEDTYHFYTPEEAARIPDGDKLFRTTRVDGCERWADRSEFLDSDIAILDPPGAAEAVRIWQANGHAVKSIYIITGPSERKSNWIRDIIENGGDEAAAALSFDERDRTEAPMFDQLEDMIQSETREIEADRALYPNAKARALHLFHADETSVWENRFDMDDMQSFAGRVGRGLLQWGSRAGGYRKFWEKEPIVLEPEDWTEAEWRALMKMAGLEPDVTTRAVIKISTVECYVDPGAKNEYRKN
ncbi:MAG: hypothetical protein NC311_10085 [Muribaculaceae bacterium]|nr:hypothetical protein [Muribaculaceae bacterium]